MCVYVCRKLYIRCYICTCVCVYEYMWIFRHYINKTNIHASPQWWQYVITTNRFAQLLITFINRLKDDSFSSIKICHHNQLHHIITQGWAFFSNKNVSPQLIEILNICNHPKPQQMITHVYEEEKKTEDTHMVNLIHLNKKFTVSFLLNL